MIKRIVIRMPNHLGDLVMATPVIEEVKKRWPTATVAALCKDSWFPLLQHHPHLDTLLPLSTSSLNYDMGILLPNSFSSAWMFFRAGIPHRIGYRGQGRTWLLTQPLAHPPGWGATQHLVDSYKHLVGASSSPSLPTLCVTAQEKKEARAWLRRLGVPKNALCIGIAPTAAYGPAKCWLPERFKALMKRMPECYFLILSDTAGIPTAQTLCQGMPASVLNLAGQTSLRQLMALIACCTACVTNDSGPMHLAAALRIPLLALFGSTNSRVTSPYHHGLILDKHVACAPCYRRICPLDFRCMTSLTTDEVHTALLKLLQEPTIAYASHL